jgi:hypothetical protein
MGLVAVWQVDPSGQRPSLCLYAAACNRLNHELVYSCNGLNQASGFLARPSTPICVLAGSCSRHRRPAATKGRNTGSLDQGTTPAGRQGLSLAAAASTTQLLPAGLHVWIRFVSGQYPMSIDE